MADNDEQLPELPESLGDLLFSSQESFSENWASVAASVFENHQGNVQFEYGTDEDYLEMKGDHLFIETSQPQDVIDSYVKHWRGPENDSNFLLTDAKSINGVVAETRDRSPDTTQGISGIPCNNNWRGDYDFDVTFPKLKAFGGSKSAAFAYSEMLDKLFIGMNVNCIIEFKVGVEPMLGCLVRAMAIFEKDEDIMEVVQRCPTHVLPNGSGNANAGFNYPEHLIRCESEGAQYLVDANSGRHSVIAPYTSPTAGMDSFRCLYKFMCLGSCTGGINRRPLSLIFTLENNGEVLGRRVVHLRICACPARDLKNEENQHTKQINGEEANTGRRVLKRTTNTEIVTVEPPSKKMKDSDGPYEVLFQAKDKATYEMLLKLRDMLNLAGMIPADIAKAYHHRQSQMLRRNIGRARLPKPRKPLKKCPPSVAVGGGCSNERSFSISLPFTRQNSRCGNTASTSQRSETVTSEPVIIKTEPAENVERWLDGIGMGTYSDTFLNNNLLQLNQLKGLTEEQWKALAIDDNHLNQIRNAFNHSVNNNVSCSQESQSSSTSQSGVVRISRVSFKRVTSLKREEKKD